MKPGKRFTPWLLLTPALLLVSGCFVVPLLWLGRVSLYERSGSNSQGGSRFYNPDTFTLSHYQELFTDSYYLQILGGTLVQAAIITLAVMLLAYPCALLIHRSGTRFKRGALLTVMLPKLTNLLVLTYGLLVLLSNSGPLNQLLLTLGLIREPLSLSYNIVAVTIAEMVIIAPYPILLLISLFESVDPHLEIAARGMGAGPFRAFYHTTFKLTLPGALVATGLSFTWASAAYIGPLLFGNPVNYTTAVEIYNIVFEQSNWPLGAALAVSNVLLILSILVGLGFLQCSVGRAIGPKVG